MVLYSHFKYWRKTMNKVISSIVIMVLSSLVLGCSSTNTIIKGKVSDSITGLPIVNAIVSDGNYGDGNN